MNAARERILAKPRIEEVTVPEWGRVRIQALTARQRVEMARMITDSDPALSTKIAAWTLVDDDGKRLFSDEEFEQLGDADGEALEAVVQACWRISGLLRDDQAGKVEAVSTESPSGASPTGSLSPSAG